MSELTAHATRLLIAALALTTASGAGARAADIVLLDRVAASGPVIRLGDVAAVLSADADEINRLGQAALMPAPAPGAERDVTVGQVRDLLGAQGWDMSALRFRGASQARVVGPAAASDPERAAGDGQQASRTAAHTSHRQTGFRIPTAPVSRRPARTTMSLSRRRVEELTAELTDTLNEFVRSATGDPMLHALDVELKQRNAQRLDGAQSEVKIETTGAISEGLQRFIVRFETDEGPVNFPVFARVRAARPAVLVTRAVGRGELITAADVQRAPLPLEYNSRADEAIAEGVDEVIGKEAARALNPGDVVTDANTLPPLLVERGEIVTVIAGGGGVRVRMQAKAMRPGRYGQLVEVQPLDSRTRFDARVVGRGELAVLSAGTSAVESVARHVEPLRMR